MKVLQKLLILLLVSLFMLTACSPAAPAQEAVVEAPTEAATLAPTEVTTSPTQAPAQEEAPIVLQIITEEGTQELTMEALQALPTVEGYAGIKSSTGKITPPTLFKGVSIRELASLTGTFDESKGAVLYAEDGYSITFSYNQIMNGDFIQYDPGTGDELQTRVELTPILAYEMNGNILDPKQDGTLRIAVISEEGNQVVDGHWAVKWVNKMEVKPLAADWTLSLEGILSEEIDRGTFESGAAPNCHEAIWTDDNDQEWVGIPLWYLVGRVDDQIKHEGPAFNDDLADAGYTVDVIASDGYTVTFDSARIKRNNKIIVAFMVNENALPDDYFPLRLVGTELEKSEMVGQITKIVLNIPADLAAEYASPQETETSEAPAASPVTGDLVITGLVENSLGLMDANLHAMQVVEKQIEHPKKGMVDYSGVPLNVLLGLARPKVDASKVVFTASDGYTAEVSLTDALACEDCLVAFTDTAGVFDVVMPGFDSGSWVKGTISIEVK
jgi:DMSO/TMAO reductase YedYZ molybdopterin-dependent catalytic subunit